MRNLEGRNVQVSNLTGFAFVEIATAGFSDLRCGAIVVVDADVYLFGGINQFAKVVSQMTDGLDVVGMVVGNENAVDGLQGESVVTKRLLERSDGYAGIYQYTAFFSLEVVTVPTAATPQSQEFYHWVNIFIAKLINYR